MDVKFLTFIGKNGEKIRRFQYVATDDATRVRALKIYQKHTQATAIDFVDHIAAGIEALELDQQALEEREICRQDFRADSST